jgi:hypothetical protein
LVARLPLLSSATAKKFSPLRQARQSVASRAFTLGKEVKSCAEAERSAAHRVGLATALKTKPQL